MANKLHLIGVGCILSLLLTCMGCANSYDATFHPPPGFIYTHTTIPLTTDVQAVPVNTTKKKSTESFYIAFPCPIIGYFDCAWTKKPSLNYSTTDTDVVYAEAEIVTVLSLFGSYKINTYHQ